jgi:hypothetical protein
VDEEIKTIQIIDRLETHDRLKEVIKTQEQNVFQGAEDCLKRNKLSLALQDRSPYIYIFAHPRTMEDGLTKALYWQPRLTKPKSQTNSYLFRCLSHQDQIEVCWILPPREMWPEYDAGKITESDIVRWSIDMFVNHRFKLDQEYHDDLSDGEIKHIYKEIDLYFKHQKLGKRLILPDFKPSF